MATMSTQHAATGQQLLSGAVQLQPLLRENTSPADAMRRLVPTLEI
jgi:hypothetical protein